MAGKMDRRTIPEREDELCLQSGERPILNLRTQTALLESKEVVPVLQDGAGIQERSKAHLVLGQKRARVIE